MADLPANDPLDEAFAAYLRSCDAGELSSREAFLEKFPDLADDLKELMEAADMIGRVTLGDAATEADSGGNFSVGADTVTEQDAADDGSGSDPAATLPMSNRAAGDPGPTLPYDLGDYQLLEVIGRGGMGVVYLAEQHHLDRMVAIKMIRGGMLADEADVKRFYTEAQAAARLHHPGIVAVHQFGRRAGHHFFSMEYIRGTDLQRKINAETLSPKLAARYVRDVARAIEHAHQNGVLHRDLKPANVLIDPADQVHVTDFGLAKHMDSDSSVTRSGAAVGTPHYMAPEQAGGQSDRASRQSDIYSLGAVLFACIAGRPPIVADTVVQTLVQVVHDPAPPLRSICPTAPADLETVVAKCLEKNPAKRYESAEDLAEELDLYLEGRPIRARPRSRAIKLWHWLEGVPLVGALSGRRVLKPSVGHRRFQAAMLLLLLMTPLFAVTARVMWNHYWQSMPGVVRIGGGLEGGVYNGISNELAGRLRAEYGVDAAHFASGGSRDNKQRLLNQLVDLAPMQGTAISGAELCVVAPLHYEVVHVLARAGSTIESIRDFPGHRVAVGTSASGSQATADLIFESLQMEDQVTQVEIPWSDVNDAEQVDAAIICIGRKSQIVTDLLVNGHWKLVPIPSPSQITKQHPALLRVEEIEPGDYEGVSTITGVIPTVGTIAYLAALRDTPSELVTAVLHVLYRSPPLCDGMIARDTAAESQTFLPFHPAAKYYYSQSDRQ